MGTIDPGGGNKPFQPLDSGKRLEPLGPPQKIPTNLGKLKQENPKFYHKLMNALITGLAMKMVKELQEQEKKRKQASREG